MTRVTFYVATAFATANVRMLRLKQFRYSFLRIYATFSIRTYVAVFLNKRIRRMLRTQICVRSKVLICDLHLLRWLPVPLPAQHTHAQFSILPQSLITTYVVVLIRSQFCYLYYTQVFISNFLILTGFD